MTTAPRSPRRVSVERPPPSTAWRIWTVVASVIMIVLVLVIAFAVIVFDDVMNALYRKGPEVGHAIREGVTWVAVEHLVDPGKPEPP